MEEQVKVQKEFCINPKCKSHIVDYEINDNKGNRIIPQVDQDGEPRPIHRYKHLTKDTKSIWFCALCEREIENNSSSGLELKNTFLLT